MQYYLAIPCMRVNLDVFNEDRAQRVVVKRAKLLLFGTRESPCLRRKSGEEEIASTWFEGDDGVARPDPTDQDVYYLCVEDVSSMFNKKCVETNGKSVIDFVHEVLLDVERCVSTPMSPTPKFKSSPVLFQDLFSNRVQYLTHLVESVYLPTFLRLLGSGSMLYVSIAKKPKRYV